MQFTRALHLTLVAAATVGGGGLAPVAQAITIQTVQPSAGSESDPVWGQGITINVGATISDALIPATVLLDFVGFRTGSASVGSPDRSAVYLQVYDAFGITAGGAVDGGAIGNLIAVSTNAVDLETAAAATDVTWIFSQPTLAKDAIYHYIMADDTVAATSGDFSNLIYSDLVVGLGNPHAGGQHYRQTGDLGSGPTSRDLFFRVTSTIPEPSTFSLAALGLLSLGFGAKWCGRS